ncbi:MAG: RNA-binding protein [Bacteroidetes bacterium HGW-Bacteroidetes-1]|nr:MAG: RNA-binding protein [Bacteroidetes bacterium HGW-Bacteroidetes-1]
MTTFELSGHDHIQLNQLLKLLNLVDSGGDANQTIVSGQVKVNGKTELQKRKKLFAGDRVYFQDQEVEIIGEG